MWNKHITFASIWLSDNKTKIIKMEFSKQIRKENVIQYITILAFVNWSATCIYGENIWRSLLGSINSGKNKQTNKNPTTCEYSSFPSVSQHSFSEQFQAMIPVAWQAKIFWDIFSWCSWWIRAGESILLPLSYYGIDRIIFRLISQWWFFLTLSIEEQGGKDFFEGISWNSFVFRMLFICFLLLLMLITDTSSNGAIFIHFRYQLMLQKPVWNKFWKFSLSIGCRINPFEIHIR